METIIKEGVNKYAKKFYENLLAANYKIANGDCYKDARSHVAIECPKGHVYQTTPDNFNGSKRYEGEETLTEEDFTYEKQLEYFDSIVRELLKADWKLNDILDSPVYYLIEVMNEKKTETKKEKSLISAFTGG